MNAEVASLNVFSHQEAKIIKIEFFILSLTSITTFHSTLGENADLASGRFASQGL